MGDDAVFPAREDRRGGSSLSVMKPMVSLLIYLRDYSALSIIGMECQNISFSQTR